MDLHGSLGSAALYHRPAPGAPLTVHRLTPTHLAAVERLLTQDVEVNLFLLGVLEAWNLSPRAPDPFYGVIDGPRVVGLCFVAGDGLGATHRLAVPAGDPEVQVQVGQMLQRRGGCRMIVGPREASDALTVGLGSPQARICYDQRLYVCRRVTDGAELRLRPGRPAEIPLLSEMAARMMAEDLGEDPREADPVGHARQVEARVESERTLVGERGGEIVFKLDVGTQIRWGAQVGGTFVPPHRRGHGIAQAGMRAATRHLLRSVPIVTLHVNEANTAAVRCYEAVGYERGAPFRLVAFGGV